MEPHLREESPHREIVETEETQANTQPEEPVNTNTQSGNLQGYQLARDRTRRQVRQPSRYANADLVYYALNAEVDSLMEEPNSFTEAVNSKDSLKQWMKR